MPKTALGLALAIAAIALAACSKSPSPAGEAAVKADVAALIEKWSRAGAEGRWDELKSLYADEPGFTWIEQGRVAYADHAAVVAGIDQASASGAKIESTVSDIEVTLLSNDTAAFHARSRMKVTSPAFSFAFDGAFSGVALRRADTWVFLQGHLSAPGNARAPN